MSVNGKKIYEFKAKYSEIKPYPLSFGNPSKKFYRWQHEKTGLSAYVYSFSVDYYILDVSDIDETTKHYKLFALVKNHLFHYQFLVDH